MLHELTYSIKRKISEVILNFILSKIGDLSSLINAHGTVIENGTADHTSIKEVRTIVGNLLEGVLKVKSFVIGGVIKIYLGRTGN